MTTPDYFPPVRLNGFFPSHGRFYRNASRRLPVLSAYVAALTLAALPLRAEQIGQDDFGFHRVVESFEEVTPGPRMEEWYDNWGDGQDFLKVNRFYRITANSYTFSSGVSVTLNDGDPDHVIFPLLWDFAMEGPFRFDSLLHTSWENGPSDPIDPEDVPHGTAFLYAYHEPLGFLEFTFPNTVSRVGAFVTGVDHLYWPMEPFFNGTENLIEVSAFDEDGQLLESYLLPRAYSHDWKNNFMGIENSAGIKSIRFSGLELLIDALTFEYEQRWGNAAGGSFAVDSNWTADRVPADDEEIVFALNETYTVNLDQDRSLAKILVRQQTGSPVLNLSGHELTLTGSNSRAMEVVRGSLDVTHGTLGTGDEVVIDHGGLLGLQDVTWSGEGSIVIGETAEGGLELGTDAKVNLEDVWVGLENEAFGLIELNGEGAELTATSAVVIGRDGTGRLQVLDGAVSANGGLLLGHGGGGHGELLLRKTGTDAPAAGLSILRTGTAGGSAAIELDYGDVLVNGSSNSSLEGRTTLTIRDYSLLTVENLTTTTSPTQLHVGTQPNSEVQIYLIGSGAKLLADVVMGGGADATLDIDKGTFTGSLDVRSGAEVTAHNQAAIELSGNSKISGVLHVNGEGTVCQPFEGSQPHLMIDGGTLGVQSRADMALPTLSLQNEALLMLYDGGIANVGEVMIASGSQTFLYGASGPTLNANTLIIGNLPSNKQASVEQSSGVINTFDISVGEAGQGLFTLSGGGASAHAAMVVGPRGIVDLQAGQLSVEDLIIQRGGEVKGAPGVEIQAGGAVRNAGILRVTITPPPSGFSVQTKSPPSANPLRIVGDYTQDGDGELVLAFAATGAPPLSISGNATIGGKVIIDFINGFVPQQGQQFTLVEVGGILDLAGSELTIRGLAPGFLYDISHSDGSWSLVALNDGVAVPDPAAPAFLPTPVIVPAKGVHGAKISATVTGPPHATILLEASTDLGAADEWDVIAQVILDANGHGAFADIEDGDEPGASKNFFRVRLAPPPDE